MLTILLWSTYYPFLLKKKLREIKWLPSATKPNCPLPQCPVCESGSPREIVSSIVLRHFTNVTFLSSQGLIKISTTIAFLQTKTPRLSLLIPRSHSQDETQVGSRPKLVTKTSSLHLLRYLGEHQTSFPESRLQCLVEAHRSRDIVTEESCAWGPFLAHSCEPFGVFTEGRTRTGDEQGLCIAPFSHLFSQSPLSSCLLDMVPGVWPMIPAYTPLPPIGCTPASPPPSLPFQSQDCSALIQVEWVIKDKTKKRRSIPFAGRNEPTHLLSFFLFSNDSMQWLSIHTQRRLLCIFFFFFNEMK